MGIELSNDLGIDEEVPPFGYIGKIAGGLAWLKSPAIADARGSSKEDVVLARRMSRGDDGKPSTKDSLPPPPTPLGKALISIGFRTSIFDPQMLNWFRRMRA